MGKKKKKILINKKEYSTNEARKFLADNLKKDNVAKCDIPKLITYLSKREAFKYYCVVGGEIYIIDIVLFNKEDRNRTNKHGENIYDKRHMFYNKKSEYESIVNEILKSTIVLEQMKESFIGKAKEITDLLKDTINLTNQNGEFTIKKKYLYTDPYYEFRFSKPNKGLYVACSYIGCVTLKEIEQRLKTIKKIKENLEI